MTLRSHPAPAATTAYSEDLRLVVVCHMGDGLAAVADHKIDMEVAFLQLKKTALVLLKAVCAKVVRRRGPVLALLRDVSERSRVGLFKRVAFFLRCKALSAVGHLLEFQQAFSDRHMLLLEIEEPLLQIRRQPGCFRTSLAAVAALEEATERFRNIYCGFNTAKTFTRLSNQLAEQKRLLEQRGQACLSRECLARVP